MNLPNKTINVSDVEGYYRLGTFTFSNSAKYAGKAFFSFVLNLLGMSDFRFAMFLDSVDRLIYFRNKRTRENISLVELASGI